jgi:hypothetical protein
VAMFGDGDEVAELAQRRQRSHRSARWFSTKSRCRNGLAPGVTARRLSPREYCVATSSDLVGPVSAVKTGASAMKAMRNDVDLPRRGGH